MNVLKFGGTSVSSIESLSNILNIIKNYQCRTNEPLLLVVSALKGVTDNLNTIFRLVSRKDEEYLKHLEEIKQYHSRFINDIFQGRESLISKNTFTSIEENLEKCLKELCFKEKVNKKDKDSILGFGEIFSAHIVTEFLKLNGHEFFFLDSKKLIVTNNNYGNAKINMSLTRKKVKDFFKKNTKNYVVTGYIGATEENIPTTLGRGGSDLTATILGSILESNTVIKWTDVNGILTADPRFISNTYSLKEITFNELINISKFGSNILIHPNALLKELFAKRIDILIKNTFDIEFPGTRIRNYSDHSDKVISINENSSIVLFEGNWMISKEIVKEILHQNFLIFRIKLNALDQKNKIY
ncbi:aspartate kinase [Aquimarina sp. RZ0]|uniref:aspartate kinase n=1 Tax=Aquimarina sp. RZ0 TaxID=2607730 RepID=UPI0011F1E29E|nr:aspartate kinase [Aquimarina sp. RZ0]KAA1239616.1 aspartate kinase [Aquimarina sp. RZ0]